MMRNSVNTFFILGIISSLLYIGTDIITGLSWQGYSFNSQTVSELSAIGAPTRPIWLVMTFIYNPLLIAFGTGVMKTARANRFLYITGIMIVLWGVLGFGWLFFPMNLRGSIGSTTDTMHLVMTAITVVLMTTLILVGSMSQGRRFRFFSIFTIVIMMVFGIVTGLQASRVAAQLPTPWMGITERMCSYMPLIWVMVLSSRLLKKTEKD
jgi:hypothetical protein